jgi:hypothetical protein
MADKHTDPKADPKAQPKATPGDLEDRTGNPGHRGVNPNAPTTPFNKIGDQDGPVSINEPPGSEIKPAPEEKQPEHKDVKKDK